MTEQNAEKKLSFYRRSVTSIPAVKLPLSFYPVSRIQQPGKKEAVCSAPFCVMPNAHVRVRD
jgi:hypothetical protein